MHGEFPPSSELKIKNQGKSNNEFLSYTARNSRASIKKARFGKVALARILGISSRSSSR